ncbi:hypothetical protein DXG01_011621 [Tephrocybe rancida]|nr:hypothetical protein DXG01_011621 [Tephrocybe rancida]
MSSVAVPQLDSIVHAGVPNPTPPEATPVVVDKMTDDEMLTLILKSPSLDLHDHSYTRLIAPSIIAKMATDGHAVPSEFLALQQVREFTTIPVPRVYRVVPMGSCSWIIMDHVSGESLFELWPSMSENEKIHLAKTLHTYVLQLRMLRHDRPDGRRAFCTESSLFGGVVDTRGPFPSYRALSDFFNKRQKTTLDPTQWGPGPQCTEPFDDSFPLVMTHKRIGLQNIVKGDDGTLWLRDWQCAGFYPEWFEYACMKQQAENLVSIRKGKDGCGGSDEAWDQFVETVLRRAWWAV